MKLYQIAIFSKNLIVDYEYKIDFIADQKMFRNKTIKEPIYIINGINDLKNGIIYAQFLDKKLKNRFLKKLRLIKNENI